MREPGFVFYHKRDLDKGIPVEFEHKNVENFVEYLRNNSIEYKHYREYQKS